MGCSSKKEKLKICDITQINKEVTEILRLRGRQRYAYFK